MQERSFLLPGKEMITMPANLPQSTEARCPCAQETCPLNTAMAVIGGKWKVQIICALNGDGPIRFNELKRRLSGVSNTVLTAALKDLEDRGLIVRQQYMEVPPRVEYFTTDKCNRLIPLIRQIAQWGRELLPSSGESR
ncbi:helix-turn-helix transcriptional regulator [Desulfosarcina sp. OttesenSCG-928-G10]|nr:helix-turn-helix transcriptional regulator [Desulfosarcina sp. OttesenSCG-928-G10]